MYVFRVISAKGMAMACLVGEYLEKAQRVKLNTQKRGRTFKHSPKKGSTAAPAFKHSP